jgi:hypothetical protein
MVSSDCKERNAARPGRPGGRAHERVYIASQAFAVRVLWLRTRACMHYVLRRG